MRWSVRLGSLFGIPVYLHFTFLLLLGFVALTRLVTGGVGAAAGALLLISSVFGLVVLHEMGHALAARHFGIGTRDVTLLPIGGVARLERNPSLPRQELWIALAGPAVNLVLAGLLGIVLLLTGFHGTIGLGAGSFLAQLMAINLGLFLFNMLPAFPMDGGRVLRAHLARRRGMLPATETAAGVGRFMALLLGIAGLFWNPMLILIALFVWFAGSQELRAVRMAHQPRWSWMPPVDPTWSNHDPRSGSWPRDEPWSPGEPPAVRVWVRRF
jgi:Zn-dependent protease